ncbi:hypothetical protein H5410_014091 [Solanum commersonii]|uniref:Uncharacterized protein n=1 Tax=Solanum commersonii TaxID=4109 RepID=A0A9J5ZQ83_SOLCO|nr:hypothetical protein H5410_014091 [Solanum commersonii]
MITQIAEATTIGLFKWAYLALLKPPPPKVCGSPGGPPVTSPRIQLNDERYVAYKERGVSKEKTKHKIIIIHGFDSFKDLMLPISQDLIQELEIYVLQYDRPSYGESDPHPKRLVKSEAFDVKELADKLLVEVAFVVLFVNCWWSCYLAKLSNEALGKMLAQDQRTFKIVHYAPWLVHWWMN